jgi:hypothetical protein
VATAAQVRAKAMVVATCVGESALNAAIHLFQLKSCNDTLTRVLTKLARGRVSLAQELTKLARERVSLAQELTKLVRERVSLAQELTKLAR